MAGPFMNAVLAIGVMTVFHMIGFGVDATFYDRPVIGAVDAASPAALADLRPGDEIRAIDGAEIDHHELVRFVVFFNDFADGWHHAREEEVHELRLAHRRLDVRGRGSGRRCHCGRR
jgi:hypothetical protein